MIKQVKGVSTLIWLLLILLSLIIGGLISYVFVMASFYSVPENATLLVVETIDFPINNFTYFNFTVLNPSYSAQDVNITAIILRVETMNLTQTVNATEPALPFLMTRGLRQNFTCLENWSNFTGQVVRVEPLAGEASTRSFPYTTPPAGLTIAPTFDFSESVQYFNLTLTNASPYSAINLTISQIFVFGLEITNTTPALPYLLTPNQTRSFKCILNWDNFRHNITMTVKTLEGYQQVFVTPELQSASLYVSNVAFDYTDTTFFNLTITSTNESTGTAFLSGINVTTQDGTTTPITVRAPIFFGFVTSYILPNSSLTAMCNWNWNSHRGQNITISVYTRQEVAIQNYTVLIPPDVPWNVTDVRFDLDDLLHFSVNITNPPVSLNSFIVTGIQINNQTTTLSPPSPLLTNGTEITFSCGYNWTDLRGQNVTITAFTSLGSNISQTVSLPAVGLKFLSKPAFGDFLGKYVNVSIASSSNSLQNVTIKTITFFTNNTLYTIDGALSSPALVPNGYQLKVGDNATITCRWDWTLYSGSLTVTVYTTEGYQLSEQWTI